MQLIIKKKKCFSFSKLDVINWSVILVYVCYCAIGSNLKEDDYHFLGSRRLNQGQHSIAILTKKKNKTKQSKTKTHVFTFKQL